MPGALSRVARHAWIVANVPGEESFRRFELGGGGSEDPFRYFGNGDVAVHGIVFYEREELLDVVDCLGREKSAYHRDHPDYFPIPGPNSNTIVDYMLRHCGVHVELPATAIGRDYRGPVGASVTSNGTGVQLETIPVGVKLGLVEGVEVHLFDMPLGFHFWPPGVTVPVNPGRIGIDGDTHRSATPRRKYSIDDGDDDGKRRYGLASFYLYSRYAHVPEPGHPDNLSDVVAVGADARAFYGKTIGYGLGFDLEAGMGFSPGFAYAARLYPVGAGLMLWRNTFFGAFVGLGSDGVGSHVPERFHFPSELRLEVDVASWVRLGSRAWLGFYPGSEERADGSELVSPFADELVLSAFARLGEAGCGCGGRMGSGYFLALERGEMMGRVWYGLRLGVQGDFGG
jgi:hypothetical protein